MKNIMIRNLLNRRSLFLRFLSSYFIVLLIPFTTIIILYNIAQKTIHEEILTSNANHLNQFVNILDIELGNMAEKASQILSSGIIRKQILYHSAISDPSSAYEIYEVKKFLDDLPQDDFYDVFVYFRKYDRIISAANSSLLSKDYYDTYYKEAYQNLMEADQDYVSFLAALNPDTLVPHLMPFGQEKNTPFLGMVLSMNYSNAKRKGDTTAVLVLKPELLENLIQNALYQNKSSIMIYDNNNNLLISSDSDGIDLDISKYTGNVDDIYYDSIHGEDYILQLFHSKVLDCTYVSVISSKTFWEKLSSITTVSMISILLTIVVSIFLSWQLARHSYLPIHSIVHAIRNKSAYNYDIHKNSELDFIKDVIIKTFRENDLLSSRIKSSKNNVFEDFILHAMQGTLSNNRFREQELEQIHMHFISDAFNILLVHIDSVDTAVLNLNSTDDSMTLSFLVENIMSELCAYSHKGFIIYLEPKVYAVVLNYSSYTSLSKKQEDALEISHSFQNFIKQHFHIQSTISISCPVDGVNDIHTAYQQALKAMEYRYLIGNGSIIPYQDINNKRFSYNNSFNSKNSMLLIHYVKESLQEDITAIMNEIIKNSMIDHNSSLNVIECFKYDLINTVNKIIFEINAVELEKQNNYINSLIYAETFEEFQEILKVTLVQLKNFRKESKEQVTICDKAEELIHECYMDSNLNNNIIADKLDISPSYLSKLFKNQKNISLLDYLYQIRLSYVKNYLRETNLTIDEIASKTGFISDSALIKAFKKYEGITPGSYRNLIT